MGLFDQHIHSRHSFDSDTEPVDNVEAALSRGLAGLTFTEHLDTHPDDWKTCCYDDEALSASIESLRLRFGSRVFIGKGIEICYQPERMGYILDFLKNHSFDLVILSVHYFRGVAVHMPEHWDGLDAAEGTRRYLESVLDAVRFCERLHRTEGRVFDVLGHLDLVKRYSHRLLGEHGVAPFPDLIDEILQACLAADVVPEVNTSTMRQDLIEPMPGPDTMARYATLGGTAMSLGSDAHRPEDVGADLDRAAAMLRTAGLTSTAQFKARRRIELLLT
jgi:histidinol-phosphatase (PHP family)